MLVSGPKRLCAVPLGGQYAEVDACRILAEIDLDGTNWTVAEHMLDNRCNLGRNWDQSLASGWNARFT